MPPRSSAQGEGATVEQTADRSTVLLLIKFGAAHFSALGVDYSFGTTVEELVPRGAAGRSSPPA